MNIAIIGAGISGLTCASTINQHHKVKVFEKARGVSGRLSTRRSKDLRFDHGAQFIRAKSDIFKVFINISHCFLLKKNKNKKIIVFL